MLQLEGELRLHGNKPQMASVEDEQARSPTLGQPLAGTTGVGDPEAAKTASWHHRGGEHESGAHRFLAASACPNDMHRIWAIAFLLNKGLRPRPQPLVHVLSSR